MRYSVTCPTCNVRYKVDESLAGKKLACRCGQVFRAPAPPSATPTAEEMEIIESFPELIISPPVRRRG